MSQTFEIPGRLMGLNEYIDAERKNMYRAAKIKRTETNRVRAAIKAAGIKPCKRPIEVFIEYVEAKQGNGAMRDVDNIYFAKKFIADALQAEGIVPNDNPFWVRNYYECCKFNQAKPRVIVAIEDYNPSGRTVTYMPIAGIKER